MTEKVFKQIKEVINSGILSIIRDPQNEQLSQEYQKVHIKYLKESKEEKKDSEVDKKIFSDILVKSMI